MNIHCYIYEDKISFVVILFRLDTQNIKQNTLFMSFFSDKQYISYCVHLALRSKGRTKTNPLVGACLVYNQKIIGEGWHTAFGKPHAEVEAIRSVSPDNQQYIPKSTLYVTLEPCNHTGKTPPCTQLIIKSGIKKVVIGCLDPNPLVSGLGVKRLKQAKIDVQVGIEEETCKELIEYFRCNILLHRPYIILKWAQSSDVFMGRKNHQVWLSNNITGRLVHQWRSETDAIFAGFQTLVTDDPKLTTRKVPGQNPTRVTLDYSNSLDLDLNFFDKTSSCIVFSPPTTRFRALPHILHIPIEDFCHKLKTWETVFSTLYQHNIGSILIEGGAHIHQSLLELGLWDEIRCIKTAKILNEGIKAPPLPSHRPKKIVQLDTDTIHFYKSN